ncbi:MAG: hypothetical protein H0X62_13880 [Bacteroidetes bacterium]|nr:hypothetical protein [Bacteroidota bacterium]
MGETFLVVAGVFILALCLIDILWTTLWIDGAAGPLTRLITYSAWWFIETHWGGLTTNG